MSFLQTWNKLYKRDFIKVWYFCIYSRLTLESNHRCTCCNITGREPDRSSRRNASPALNKRVNAAQRPAVINTWPSNIFEIELQAVSKLYQIILSNRKCLLLKKRTVLVFKFSSKSGKFPFLHDNVTNLIINDRSENMNFMFFLVLASVRWYFNFLMILDNNISLNTDLFGQKSPLTIAHVRTFCKFLNIVN